MPIEGETDDAEYRLRQQLGDGEIEGHEFRIALNIDGQCVFIEFVDDDETVMYKTQEMVIDAYQQLYDETSEVVVNRHALLEAIELLEDVMGAGKRALSHDEVRPSSHMMATKGREAYQTLVEAHPDYELSEEDDGE